MEVIVLFSVKRDRHVQTKQTDPISNCSIFCRLNLIPLLVTLMTTRYVTSSPTAELKKGLCLQILLSDQNSALVHTLLPRICSTD